MWREREWMLGDIQVKTTKDYKYLALNETGSE